MAGIEERIGKDIEIFYQNLGKLVLDGMDGGQRKIVELARMYAEDSKSFLEKKDYYTSFSSIAYAHGLLDAVLKLNARG